MLMLDAVGVTKTDAANPVTVSDPVMEDTIAVARKGYARNGKRGLLEDLYAVQKMSYAEGKIAETILARTCILLGRKQQALQFLKEDYTRHSETFIWCLSDPTLLSLKDEPRYKELMKKINFPTGPHNAEPNTPAVADHAPLFASSNSHSFRASPPIAVQDCHNLLLVDEAKPKVLSDLGIQQ
jgi:hypothetical protein